MLLGDAAGGFRGSGRRGADGKFAIDVEHLAGVDVGPSDLREHFLVKTAQIGSDEAYSMT